MTHDEDDRHGRRRRRRAEREARWRDGYEDRYTRSPNPRRFYKNVHDKVLAGVLSGLADYVGWDKTWVRIAAVVALFTPLAGIVVVGYLVLAIAAPRRPYGLPVEMPPEEDAFWRDVDRRPRETFEGLKYRFQDLDMRMADMERVMTGEEWRLRRAFADLEKKA